MDIPGSLNVEEMKRMGDKELIELYKAFWDAVYRVQCYGVYEFVAMKLIEEELARRGYVVETVEIPRVRKRKKMYRKTYRLTIKKK
jgi:hypothetical protein